MKVGGIRMSTTATSGRSRSTDAPEVLGIGDGVGDDESTIDQQLHQAVPEDGRVLGDGDLEGIRSS